MKVIQGIMLLTIMLAVSCSNEPGKDDGGETKTPEQIFVETINGKLVWDSNGIELMARTNDDGSGMLAYDYKFHSLVTGSTTQAIYEMSYGSGFIGVELFDDNKQAVMYKKGTVEEWASIADVSFSSEHKMESSAKGEWIASAKSKTISIDSTEYTMKNDGHLYSAPVKEDGEDILTFTHVSTTQPVTRTPDDGFLRDRAIYKKGDTEFFGLLADPAQEALTVYKDGTVNYWSDEASVKFEDANKVDPLANFKALIAGTYTGVYDINATSKLELVDLTIDADGNISKANTILYTLVSLKPNNKAVFSLQVDAETKYIGFSFIEAGKMTLHRKDRSAVYDTEGAVVIDDTTLINPVNIFKHSLPKGEQPIGAELLTVNIDGNLYDGETVKYTFVELHTHVDYTGIQTTNAIYTDTASKFIGIQVDIVENKIYPYRLNKSEAWVNKADVNFEAANKVSAPDTWDSVGTGLVEATVFWPSAIIDNDGNVILVYEQNIDRSKLSIQRFNSENGVWTSITDGTVPAWGPNIAKDSHGNLYAAHESDGQNLSVTKWVKNTATWENMGTGTDRFVTGVKGQKASITVDKDDNIYVLHSKTHGATSEGSVRKYNSGTKEWDLVGPANAIKGASTKQILATSTGELWVSSVVGAVAGNFQGDLVVQRYNTTDDTWDTVGGAEGTGYIDKAWATSMGIDHNNNVYVAYENGSDRKATILKLNANKDGWDTIGTGIGNGEANHIRIAFYSDGTPIITSSGDPSNKGVEVLKYENGVWSKVGKDPQVSAGNAFYSGLVVNTESDTIYAAYSDRTLSGNGLSVRQHVRVP